MVVNTHHDAMVHHGAPWYKPTMMPWFFAPQWERVVALPSRHTPLEHAKNCNAEPQLRPNQTYTAQLRPNQKKQCSSTFRELEVWRL